MGIITTVPLRLTLRGIDSLSTSFCYTTSHFIEFAKVIFQKNFFEFQKNKINGDQFITVYRLGEIANVLVLGNYY